MSGEIEKAVMVCGIDAVPPKRKKAKAKAAATKDKKPRKSPVRRVFGRLLRSVEVRAAVPASDGKPEIAAVRKLFWFELQQSGIFVRQFRKRRRSGKLLPLELLANHAKDQPELFV